MIRYCHDALGNVLRYDDSLGQEIVSIPAPGGRPFPVDDPTWGYVIRWVHAAVTMLSARCDQIDEYGSASEIYGLTFAIYDRIKAATTSGDGLRFPVLSARDMEDLVRFARTCRFAARRPGLERPGFFSAGGARAGLPYVVIP